MDVDPDGLAETIEGLSRVDSGASASTHMVDVAESHQMAELPEQVIQAPGGFDLLVNNAGVSLACPFHLQDLDDFRWLMGINF